MISKLTYVNCDECGSPSEPVIEGATEARRAAQLINGFKRIEGRDLCPKCRGEEWDGER